MFRLHSCTRVDLVLPLVVVFYLATSQIQKNHDIHREKKVQVKIGGDGAKFSHTSSFILFSFSFPGTAKNVLSGYGKYFTQDTLIVFVHTSNRVPRLFPRF